MWDSQLGTTAAPTNLAPLADDEDFDEPEIPEYLIAEQRRGARGGRAGGGQGGRGGPRGGRAAYQSAMDRERYGRGGGGGINRYPDVSGRTAGAAPSRGRNFEPQGDRPRDRARPTGSAEPWSEVPPELEEMLRAQVSQRPSAPSSRPTEVPPGSPIDVGDEPAAEAPAAPKRRTRSATSKASTAKASAKSADEEAPKRRTRKTATASAEDGEVTPKRRATRKTASATAAAAPDAAAGDEPADSGTVAADPGDAPATAPKRRTTRRTTKPAP